MDRSEAYNNEAHAAFSALDPPIPVLGDADEWGAWDAVGDPVLHIQVWLDTWVGGRSMLRLGDDNLRKKVNVLRYKEFVFTLFPFGVSRAVLDAAGCNFAARSYQRRAPC